MVTQWWNQLIQEEDASTRFLFLTANRMYKNSHNASRYPVVFIISSIMRRRLKCTSSDRGYPILLALFKDVSFAFLDICSKIAFALYIVWSSFERPLSFSQFSNNISGVLSQ